MNIRDMLQAEIPVGNRNVNAGNLRSWYSLLLGGVVLFTVVGISRPIAGGFLRFLNRIPLVGGLVADEPVKEKDMGISILGG